MKIELHYDRGWHTMAGIVPKLKPLSLFFLVTLSFSFLTEAYAADPPLRVAYKTDNPFYQFTSEQGIAEGINVDLMNAIARENHHDVEYIPMEKLWDCIKALDAGEVDIVLGVPSSEEGPFLSSMEMITATISILSRNEVVSAPDRDTYSSYTALLEYNTANISLISNIAASTYIVSGTQKEMLLEHLAGQGDFMICDRNCVEYLLRQYGIEERFTIVQENIGTVGYVAAVRKGNVALLRLINDGLTRLRLSGEYDRIRVKWIPDNPDPKGLIARIVRVVFVAAAVVSLCVFVFILVSTRIRNHLKKEVREKTKELNLRITQLQSEGDLRKRIIERSPNGIILFDRDGKVTLANSSASRIMNCTTSPVGRDVRSLPLFKDILKKHEGEGFVGEHQVSNNVYALTSGKGHRKLYQYSILPIMDGDVCGSALITVEDITVDEEKKQAVMERKKNETLNVMLAGIAHEIKNPLTGISNFAKLIQTKRDDKQFLDYFSLLVPREVDRINKLVESMMRYARPPKGNPETIDLSLVAGECAFMVGTTIKNKRIDIVIDLPGGMLISADRDQINQVLINIMLNSVASMERKLQGDQEQGRLTLKVAISAHEDYIVLVIHDEGEGMSAQTIQYCTELFYTSKSTGMGLGLALSKQLIQENNGTLHIESVELAGTQMTLQFRRIPA